jgi:hypothetical protein
MKKLLLIGLAVVVLTAGCKKTTNTSAKASASKAVAAAGGSSEGPSVHASTGVVINPGLGGGGSGGAAQAVRKAAMSAVTRHEMENIRLFIENASGATGQMPSVQEVSAALQKEAPKTWKLVQEGAIVLTGTRTRESIWAYTKETQNNGAHIAITASGIENMSGQELNQRLRQQAGQ